LWAIYKDTLGKYTYELRQGARNIERRHVFGIKGLHAGTGGNSIVSSPLCDTEVDELYVYELATERPRSSGKVLRMSQSIESAGELIQ
jgi:hypothetical protein